ncbi:choice-of-anchor L domain-containing protein [Flavobacterium sp.]|uniref:choice-of-anchor L domain-containing protein n=1 Tax=Flavobacterium sp. TaxID=239 RepID=UPI003D291189
MKLKQLLFIFVVFISLTKLNAQITIDNTTYTPAQLVDGVLVPATSGTTISNVVFGGVYGVSSRYQVGYFSTATTTLAQMGFSNGVVLSTGNTSDIPLTLGVDPRSVGQMSRNYTSCTAGEIRQGGTCPAGINDVDVLAGAQNYFNASILEFDFVPVENSVVFRYIFGSEEYSDDSGIINYQCSTYNDKFGFLISGPGISGGSGYTNDARNIARLTNGSEVSINSVNSGVVGSSGGAPNAANCTAANGAWVQNTPTPEYLGTIDGTQLNGNTRILTATQTGLTPGQTYHIKLIVTDVNDGAYDSVVYLEAGSFTTEFTCNAGPSQQLCDATSTTLAATSPATGTWSVVSGTGTFVSNTDPNTVVNGLSAGANVFRWTASDLSCNADVTITVNSTPPVPTITTSAATCSAAGSSTITNYNAANTYVFTPAGPTVGATGLISGMTVGTSYTVISGNGSCSSVASASFSNAAQLTTPAVPTITTSAATCSAAGSSTITNYNAANTYVFTPAGPTVGATGLISGMTVGTSYTVTSGNGSCTSVASTSFSNAAQLTTPPVPTITTSAATCSAAGSSTITNYNAANTYVFTPAGPTVGATGLISGMTVGTSYTVISGNGSCTSVASTSFSNAAQLTTPPVPTITTSAATCSAAGSSTITNYNAANTYVFTPAGPTVGATGSISGMTVGTSYTVTSGNGSCTSVASASFSNAAQLTTPPVPTITTSAATCSAAGSSTITNYNATNTYVFTPAGPTVGATGLISGMTVGTSYTVTSGNGSCTSVASTSFSNAAQLTTPPVPTITTSAATCSAAGSSTITNYNAANTYVFTPAGPTVGATGLISGMTVGTSYTVTSGNGSCTSVASASFSNAAQLTTPPVPTITTSAATCSAAGSSTITNYNAANTYVFTPAGPTVGATGLISGMTVGTSYTVTSGNGSCTSVASTSFSNAAQLTTPPVPTITTSAATCSAAGSSTITNYNAANTYVFTPAGPTVGATGLISGMTVGTSYTVTSGNGSCTSVASTSFSNAAQLTTPPVPTITTSAATCSAAGSSTITNYNAANTYVFTPAGPTVGATGLISGMTVGTSYTVTSGNGSCTSVASTSFSNAAQLTTPPVPTITTSAATCSAAGSSSITNYNAANTYVFTPSGPTVGATGLISGMTVGTSYTVTSENGSCTSVASASFSIDEQLVSPLVTITHGCNGIDYQLIASETLNASYQWFNSNGDLIGSNSMIVVATPDTYEVQVSLNGCITNDFVTINYTFCSIPKGVSPNGDGLNDSWDLSNFDIDKVEIFNRYGTEVYSKRDYTNEWNGRSNNGNELPTATYYYVIFFKNNTTKTGWVYLNREN